MSPLKASAPEWLNASAAATLQGVNERLIHCSISGFGREGPLRNSPGYDVILQAFAGVMSMTGDEAGGYIRSPISPIDQMTGTHAVIGILAAILERQITGKGGTIKVSLLETALALQRYNLQSFWQLGVQPARQECGVPDCRRAPQGALGCTQCPPRQHSMAPTLASHSGMCCEIYITSGETVQIWRKLHKLATLTIINYNLV
jgi:crotonobetainyl-CoA:carnitine CoA-transferase CaiB-like acyl-CoA transferase